MTDIINPLLNTTIDLLKVTREAICPYIERPSEERKKDAAGSDFTIINASDLFSFFTADIIKEQVVFIR